MSKQRDARRGQELLNELEALMDKYDAPFDDAKCNTRWKSLRKKLDKLHEDMAKCIGDGDPEIILREKT